MPKILYPLSLVYSALSNIDKSLTNSKKLNKPVISVGNITWGGTGKTPVVIELLEELVSKNIKPAVLTRGYGRKSKKAVLLQNGAEDMNVSVTGDEPLLIARSVPAASVIVGSDRFHNAVAFEKNINPDVYILDDGFQHWKIKRDLDIVCVNAANPFGNGMIIPAGILRESPEALKRAGVVVITNADMAREESLKKLKDTIFNISGKPPVITCYGNYEYKTVGLNNKIDTETLKKTKNYLLSGIGFSKGFENSVKKTGIGIEKSVSVSDHKNYDFESLNKIFETFDENSCLIITAKDAVKIEKIAGEDMKKRIAVLTVKPQFITGKEQWENGLKNLLRYS